ncbi:MAG TPA: diguanylate cyclase [bacterium]|jgi:GGDEF domain-containing protein
MTTPTPAGIERRISYVRLLVLFALLPILWWDVIPPESEIALTWLTAAIAAYILITLWLVRRSAVALRTDLSLLLDILLIGALVYYTGGINSSLLVLLYLPVLGAAIRSDLRNTVLSAVAVSALVVWLWLSRAGGIVTFGESAVRVTLFGIGSFVLAIVFGMLAQETRLSAERVSLNRILDERLAEATAQLRRRVSDLESAYALSRRLAATTDVSQVLDAVAEAARSHLNAPFGAVFLYEGLGAGLSLACVRGTAAGETSAVMYECSERLHGQLSKPFDVIAPEGIAWTQALCAPLTAGGRLIGALAGGGGDGWAPPDGGGDDLMHVADQGGVALERAYVLEDLQRLATTDPTAWLQSQAQLDQMLREEIHRATGLGAPFALLKCRLPRRPAAAAPASTELLAKRVASVIIESARRVDVVARAGPDAFFILLPMTNAESARKFGAQLQRRISADAASGRLAGAGAPQCAIALVTFPEAGSVEQLHFALERAMETAYASGKVVWAGEVPVR